MKRNQISTRAMRLRTMGRQKQGNSRYAQKVSKGQMYGDGSRPGNGCCANSYLFGMLK